MPTSQDTISQVRNILRKMDQTIDAARSKRLVPVPAREVPQPGSAAQPGPLGVSPPSASDPLIGLPAGALQPGAIPTTPTTQRARPRAMRRDPSIRPNGLPN